MTDRFKNLAKNGWHPESKSGAGGTGVRGRVSGLVHRNKKDEPSNHVARPISELKDTSSFAPPPKRTGTGLAAPPPRSTETRKVVAAPSKYQDPRGEAVAPPAKVSQSPELEEYQAQHRQQQQQGEDGEEPAPRGPYRSNTSGLKTDHLPPPPARRDGADGRAPPPPPYESATRQVPPKPAPRAAGSKPSLPPRLPPRTNSASPASSSNNTSNNNSSSNLINQGAANRLGAAGVSVPGLGIKNNPQPAATSSPSPPPPPRQPASQVNELQNRFSRFRSGSSPQKEEHSPLQAQAPAEGTTWEQKQAAVKTASAFQKDPSSVSMTDAKAAAGTANNFRQRHGEQVASGVKSANGLNQKYGVSNKIGGFMARGQEQQQPEEQNTGVTSSSESGTTPASAPAPAGLAGKKKPPPPPPPKKPSLGKPAAAPTAATDEPPPIPLSTKPTF